ncbi:hypothetical protein KDD30_06395 [Photobacterium sp. GJ3]|uniref:hypothetical protein n=1 Tax=Photobacterium sp. GJ3 TaxID=2829502 RepID=UPI001B8AF80F|nr:hypothetical protein [Photobacterium sp. GJ3]QUJ68725.1 hypothetical protein KDD30_06395 [Photobacterium sp. GJ3]
MLLYNKYLPYFFGIFLLGFQASAFASDSHPVYITPYWGYAFPDNIDADGGLKIAPDNNDLIGITVEGNYGKQRYQNGRIGFTAQHMNMKTDGFTDNDESVSIFHFQASNHYRIAPMLTSFIGLSVGGTLIEASWSKQDILFSGGAFFGSDFFIDNNVRIRLEARWIANRVDGKTSASCDTDSGPQACDINIDIDWLSFYQTNLGVSFVF